MSATMLTESYHPAIPGDRPRAARRLRERVGAAQTTAGEVLRVEVDATAPMVVLVPRGRR